MGLFKRTDPATKLAEAQAKSRAQATKRGVHVDGAMAVDHTYADGAEQSLVVWPDRVELHHHGKTGSFLQKGAGVTVLPMGKVSSVSANNRGVWNVVQVVSADSVLEFRTDVLQGPALAECIRQQSTARAS